MCLDPISMAALGVTALGGALQAKGAAKAEKARSNVANAETARQSDIRARQAQVFADSLAGFDAAPQDQVRANLTAARGAPIDEAILNTGGVDPAAGIEASAPTVVKTAAAKSLAGAIGRARDEGKKLAKLQGFGDLFFNNAVDLNRSGITQGQLGDFSRGSVDVLPLELEAANKKGSKLRSFGSLLQGVGQVAGMANAAGAFTPSPGPATYSKPMAFPWSPVG